MEQVNILLDIPARELTRLKELYADLVEKIEDRHTPFIQQKQLAPLSDMLTDLVRANPEMQEALGRAHDRGDYFEFRLVHSDPEILNLPWALARDRFSGRRLESLSQVCLSRCFPSDTGAPFPDIACAPAPLPLKILVMVSSPLDATHKERLGYEEEELAILHAFEPLLRSGEVEIHFTNSGSLQELERKVARNRYHILHFSGHGGLIDGEGVLYLENEYTLKTRAVKGADFARALLRDDYRIPLVVLSACQTAAGSLEKGFSGVCRELFNRGFPAVAAMSMSVQDVFATRFAGSFYSKLSLGDPVHRAFRDACALVKTLELGLFQQGTAAAVCAPFQYLIPVLFSRAKEFCLFDPEAPRVKPDLESHGYVTRNSRFHKNIPDFTFIGRRLEKAEVLTPMFERRTILLKGMGGVGKTALAVHLAQRYIARYPETEPFFFNEESRTSDDVLRALQRFLVKKGEKLSELKEEMELFDTGVEKTLLLAGKIMDLRGRAPLFIFDNLESFQENKGGASKEIHADMAELIGALGDDDRFPVILTGRYDVSLENIAAVRDLNQIGLTDFWKKCMELAMAGMARPDKKLSADGGAAGTEAGTGVRGLKFFDIVKILYKAFGGNFRALEFFNEIYEKKPEEVAGTIKRLAELPETYERETLIRMSENLLFSELTGALGPWEKELLGLLARFNVPVQLLALRLQYEAMDRPEPENMAGGLKTLQDLTLIEAALKRERMGDNQPCFYVTPIIKRLMNMGERDGTPEIGREGEIGFSHSAAGHYFYALVRNNVGGLTEDAEAFGHFFQAGDCEKLQEIGKFLANHYYRFSYFRNALSYCLKTEQVCRERTDSWFYNTTGAIFQMFGAHDRALAYYEKSLAGYRVKGDRGGEGTTLNNISQIFKARGDYESALTYLQQSLEIFRDIGDRSKEGTTLNNISQIHSARGDYESALTYLQQSLEISREIGDRSGEGTTLNNISQIHYARGDYESALTYLQQSLEIRREIGDRSGEGTTLNNISQIHSARGDYETALTYLQQSLEISREIGDRRGEGTTLGNMGALAHSKGDYESALTYLQQSLELFRDIGDRSKEGAALNNISQIHDARGDYETALTYLQQSLEIRREIGDRSGEGTTLGNMGALAHSKGDYESALTYLQQSLEIRREIGDLSGMSATLFNMGHIHLTNKDKQSALRTWVTAYGIARKIGLAQVLSALDNLAKQLGGDGLSYWEQLSKQFEA